MASKTCRSSRRMAVFSLGTACFIFIGVVCQQVSGFSLDCNTPDNQNVCSGTIIQDINDINIIVSLCPHFCGFCGAPTTTPTPATTATTITITTTTTASVPVDPLCVDNIGNGLTCSSIPNICQDRYAPILCRRYCNMCTGSPPSTQPPTSAPPSGDCVDHVVNNRKCSDIFFICRDPFAQVFCPKTCGLCPDCTDNIINGLTCNEIDHVCNSTYGASVCRKFCNACSGSTTPAGPPSTSPPPGTCDDFVGNGQTCAGLQGVCQDPERIGPELLCPKYCGTCTVACRDNTINGLTCDKIDHVCSSTYGARVCRKFCKACTGPTAPPGPASTSPPFGVCTDFVGNGETCAELQDVCDDPEKIGQFLLCPKHCGICTGLIG